MGYTTQQFIEKIKPYAIEDMHKNKILASLTIAQGILESNSGNSGLTTNANNLFGIKGSYNGQSVKMWTTEYVKNQKVRVLADFRKYPSWLESIYDHSDFLRRYKRYASIIGDNNYRSVAEKIGKSGYATDKDYDKKILDLMTRYKLYEFDSEMPNDTPLVVTNRRTLKRGMRGDDVKLVQQILMNNGYDLGKWGADGQFGAQTEKIIKQFQNEKGLIVDGIVGKKTWLMLEQYN